MFESFAEFAPAKVNLALHVLGRRADGYHELDSIVAFADIGDTLAFAPAERFGITASGPFAADLPSADENIIAKAWRLMRERVPGLPPAAIHLTKDLPVASGIGGGSANAAAAIRGAMKIAGIALLDDGLRAAALSLGADVPVCLAGRTCRMQGIGERVEFLSQSISADAILVNPRVEVSTPAVFAGLGLEKGQGHAESIADVVDRSGWRNDLTAAAIALKPVIGDVMSALDALPRNIRCFMSGSGATCVAMFESRQAAEAARDQLARHHPGWWIEAARLG